MPISLILTPYDHFHFRLALAVKCIPDLRVRRTSGVKKGIRVFCWNTRAQKNKKWLNAMAQGGGGGGGRVSLPAPSPLPQCPQVQSCSGTFWSA